jgi:hypothetical protein
LVKAALTTFTVGRGGFFFFASATPAPPRAVIERAARTHRATRRAEDGFNGASLL